MTFFSYILGLLLIFSNFAFTDNAFAGNNDNFKNCTDNSTNNNQLSNACVTIIGNTGKVISLINELQNKSKKYQNDQANQGNNINNDPKKWEYLAELNRLKALGASAQSGNTINDTDLQLKVDFGPNTDATNLNSQQKNIGISADPTSTASADATAFASAKAAFVKAAKKCETATKNNVQDANQCCAVKEAQDCSAMANLDDTINKTTTLLNGALEGDLSGVTGVTCDLLTNSARKQAKLLESVYNQCDAALEKIKNCEGITEKKLALDKAAAKGTSEIVTVQKQEVTALAAEFNKKHPKLPIPDIDEKIETWASNKNIIKSDIGTLNAETKRLSANTSTCINSLTLAANVEKYLNKKDKGDGGGLTSVPPFVIDPPPTLVPPNTTEEGFTNNNIPEPDPELDPVAGPTDNKDGEFEEKNTNSGNTPSSARAAGLPGFNNNGAVAGTKIASVSGSNGPSSVLKGFSRSTYTVGFSKNGAYKSSPKYSVTSVQRKNSKRKRKAFNLNAFLPGGTNSTNRKLASIGGAGVDIFSVMSSKFQSICSAKQLLECK